MQSSITYLLGATEQNLTPTGTAAIDGSGNALANVLSGNAGNNTLAGGAGGDTYSAYRGMASTVLRAATVNCVPASVRTSTSRTAWPSPCSRSAVQLAPSSTSSVGASASRLA